MPVVNSGRSGRLARAGRTVLLGMGAWLKPGANMRENISIESDTRRDKHVEQTQGSICVAVRRASAGTNQRDFHDHRGGERDGADASAGAGRMLGGFLFGRHHARNHHFGLPADTHACADTNSDTHAGTNAGARSYATADTSAGSNSNASSCSFSQCVPRSLPRRARWRSRLVRRTWRRRD